MRALVLKEKGVLAIETLPQLGTTPPGQLKIRMRNIGICGSDVHYFQHGRIGPYVVESPMVLGHEASGEVIDIGDGISGFSIGDRVCMEPGVPNEYSKATKLGLYNLDPQVRFWATPPIDGCMAEEVFHPASYTFKLPESVSYAEGAMVEPLATGLQAAKKAGIEAGDVVLVIGAGTIGVLSALTALAAGASKVIVSDIDASKLQVAAQYSGLTPVNVLEQDLSALVAEHTDGWGVNSIFEASGSAKAFEGIADLLCPNGCLVLIGMPVAPVPLDIVAMQSKEIRIESVFRYANVFGRAVELIASGKVDVKPLITGVYDFDDSIKAYQRAANGQAGDVKIQIEFP